MSTENIDVVINPGQGARQVIRQLDDIANSARNAGTNVQGLQQSINSLGNSSGLSRFQQQLNGVNTQLQAMNAQMATMNGGLNRMGAGSTAGLGSMAGAVRNLLAALTVKQVMDWSDAWAQAEGKIKTLAPSMVDTAAVMERLFAVAQNTRQPIEKLAQLYHVMTISAKDLGASQNEMIQVTDVVAKTLAIQGTKMTEARGAILQLGQAFGTGRVRAQEFNSMMTGMPLLLQQVSKHIEGAGGSTSKLRQIMLSGKLSSQEFFNALLKASAEVDEMFKNAPKTFGQAFTVLNNAMTQYVGKMNEASGASNAFFKAMEGVSANIDNVAKSLLLMGTVLLALPFGPIGVAVAAAAVAMSLFGDKILVGIDNTTTLKDVAVVAWGDMLTSMDAVQKKLSAFGTDIMPGVQSSFEKLGSVTLLDMAKAAATAFDTMIQGAVGGAAGIGEAFGALPMIVDEVGKRMFNALVGWIEAAINKTIDGLNVIANYVGQDLIKNITLDKANINQNAFKDTGAEISRAVSEGMKGAGNPVAKNLEDVMARAGKVSAERFYEEFRKSERNSQNTLNAKSPSNLSTPVDNGAATRAARDQMTALNQLFAAYKQQAAEMTELEQHKNVMLKASYDSGLMNFGEYSEALKDMQKAQYEEQKKLLEDTLPKLEAAYDSMRQAMAGKKGATSQEAVNQMEAQRLKIDEVTGAIEKLNRKNEERIAIQNAAALKPFIDFDNNMERQLAKMQEGLNIDRQKLDLQGQINGMSEKELFIREGIQQQVAPYLVKLAEVQQKMREMSEQKLVDSNSPENVAAFGRLQARAEEIKGIIGGIPQAFAGAFAQAFDAAKIKHYSDDLRSGIADAFTTAIFEGGKKGGEQLRDFLKKMLLETPFKMTIEAFIKPITEALASGIGAVVNGITGNLGGILGGAANLGTVGATLGGAVSGIASGAGAVFTGGGAAAVAGGGMGAVGALGVYGALAYGAYKIIDHFFGGGGGPKIGGYVGAATLHPEGSYVGRGDEQNAQLTSDLTRTIETLNANFARMAALTGRPTASFGVGVSTDPRGDAPSFVEMTARGQDGAAIFSKISLEVGRDAAALSQTIQQFGMEATQAAMAAYGITQEMVDAAAAAQAAAPAIAAANAATTDSAAASQQAAAAAAAQGASAEQQAAAAAAAAAQAQANALLVGEFNTSLIGFTAGITNLIPMTDSAKLALIGFAGGLSNLQQGMQQFYSIFFTEEEQRMALITQVNATLAAGGVAMNAAVATREQFRALATSLDLNTAAGQQAFAALMSVAGAFGQITDNSKALAAAAQAEAQAKAEAAAAQARAEAAAQAEAARAQAERHHQEMMAAQERARWEAEQARQKAAWEAEQQRLQQEREQAEREAEQERQRIHNENVSNLERAYSKQKGIIEEMINATEQWGNSLKSFKSSLLTDSNSPFTPRQRYANARTEYDKVLNDLSSSDPKVRTQAQNNFQQVAKTFLDASKTVNASSVQYQADYAKVMQDTDKAITLNESQHMVALQQLEVLNNQVKYLIDISDGVMSVADAIRAFDKEQQGPGVSGYGAWNPNQRYMAGAQVSYNGQNYVATDRSNSVWNENTRPDLNVSYGNVQGMWAPMGSIAGTPVQNWDWQRRYMPGDMVIDPANGVKYQATQLSASIWNENSGPMVNPLLWTAMPGHAGGLDFVPRDNYMFRAHYGEAVLNANEASQWRSQQANGGSMDIGPLIAAIAALRQEVADLREQHAAGVSADIAAQEQAAREVSDRIVQGMGTVQDRATFKTQQRSKAKVT